MAISETQRSRSVRSRFLLGILWVVGGGMFIEDQSKQLTGTMLPLVLEEIRQPAGDPGTQATLQHAQRDGANSQADLSTHPITHRWAPRDDVG